MKKANQIASLIGIAIAMFFFVLTFQFKQIEYQDTGPALMPRLYSGVLIVLALILFFNSYRTKEKVEKGNVKMALITMALVLTIVVLIPIIGFYIITPIVIFVFLKICQQTNKKILFGLPIGVVLFIFVFFQKILSVPIPTGIFFQ